MLEAIIEIFNLMQAELSDEYINNSYVFSAIVGFIFFAFFLVAAIKYKKARGLGITAGILQILGTLGAAMSVVAYHSYDLIAVVKGEGSNQAEAEEALKDALSSALSDMLGGYVLILIGSLLTLLAWIFALIYIVKIKSEIMKGFAISSMIIHIIRFVLISPTCLPIDKIIDSVKVTEADQLAWDYVYYVACAIPFILLFIGALIGKKKVAPVVAREDACAQPVEATTVNVVPAEAVPVAEQEVAECTDTDSAE